MGFWSWFTKSIRELEPMNVLRGIWLGTKFIVSFAGFIFSVIIGIAGVIINPIYLLGFPIAILCLSYNYYVWMYEIMEC